MESQFRRRACNMWISKRYQSSVTTKLLNQMQKQQNKNRHVNRRIAMKPQNAKSTAIISKKFWNILPQGLWLKSENFSMGQNVLAKNQNTTSENRQEEGIFGNLKMAFKGALEKHELLQKNQKKLDTAMDMTDYVSHMMKDYFTSDNLWKVVTKPKAVDGNVDNETIESTKKEVLPKFIQKRENMKDRNLYYSQSAIDSNTRHCVERLKESNTSLSTEFRLDELNSHLHKFPLAAILANKLGAQPLVHRICQENPTLQGLCSEILGRLGYQEQLSASPGLRILSIDGGGMKGVMALEILRRLEKSTGKRIYQLFDYCIGVSTGSIIIGLLALKKMSVDEVTQIYEDIGAQVFEQSYLKAMTGMVRSQSYYDTSKYEVFLKEFAGEDIMASTISDPECPRVAFVSAIMSSSRHSVSPFIFRNYAMPFMVSSNFRGSSRFQIWEAVRASSAAPGFFDDFKTKGLVFQDGALIANNPSSIGLHEAQHLWPNEKLQCLVSLGMGRYEPLLIDPYEEAQVQSSLSVKDKFSKLILSTTDTEMTHFTLRDLLPDDRYYRFNPYLSEIISMDETRVQKISLMRSDAQMHCRQNVRRLDLVSKLTTEKPTSLLRAKRKLLKSMESSSNNSLTAVSLSSAAAFKRVLQGKVPFHQIMTNILSNMKYK